MKYGLKFYTQFTDRFGTAWRDEIAEKNYMGRARALKVYASEPIVVDYSGGAGKNEMGAGIVGSRTVSRVAMTGEARIENLFHEDPKRFRRTILKNGSLFWQGWVISDLLEEPMSISDYLSIEAVDGLADLKDVSFLPNVGIQVGYGSAVEVIRTALKQTGLELDLWTADDVYEVRMDTSRSPLSQFVVNFLAYLKNGEDFESAWDVLQDLCLARNAQLVQCDGVWHFRRVSMIRPDLVTIFPFSFSGNELPSILLNLTKSISVKSNLDLTKDSAFVKMDQKKRFKRSLKQVQMKYEYGQGIDYARENFASGWFVQSTPPVPAPGWDWAGSAARFEPGSLYSVLFQNVGVKVIGAASKSGVDNKAISTKAFEIRSGTNVKLSIQFKAQNLAGTKISVITYSQGPGFFEEFYVTETGRLSNDLTYINKGTEYEYISASSSIKYLNQFEKIEVEFQCKMFVKVVVYRGYDTDIDKIKKLPDDSKIIEYCFLRLTAVATDDKAEVFEVKRSSSFGEKQNSVSVKIGDSKQTEFYGTLRLMDQNVSPTEYWYRLSNPTERRRMLEIAALEQIAARRKPALLLSGSLFTSGIQFTSGIKIPELFPLGSFRSIELSGDPRGGTYSMNLVEILCGDPEHTSSHYAEEGDGELRLLDSKYHESDIVEETDENAMLITFLEPNGPHPTEFKMLSGPLIQGGPTKVQAQFTSLAWFDPTNDGPWTITARLQTQVVDYVETWVVSDIMRTTILLPPMLSPTITVMNQSGMKASRKASGGVTPLGNPVRLRATNLFAGCSLTNQPVLAGSLINMKKDLKISVPPITIQRGDKYKIEVLSLITGKLIYESTGSDTVLDYPNNTFSVPLPEDWQSADYGIRMRGLETGDWCGAFTTINRCAETKPRWFGGRFGARYKRKIGG